MTTRNRRRATTVTHWGAFEVETDGRTVLRVDPFPDDPDPSPIGQSLCATDSARIARPAIRRSWLEDGPGARTELRGAEPFVEVSWSEALDRLAAELDRVRAEFGNQAIFGGSYGWASAGRFHHAQSQLHRFLALIGGYTRSVNTYSHAAAEVIVPHVLGMSYGDLQTAHTSWPLLAEHCDLFVSFGGVPVKNAQVQNGGQGRHRLRDALRTAHRSGTRFVNVSPIRDDTLAEVGADWLAVRPNTDVAVMLGLAHSIVTAGAHDEDFLTRYCVGWERLAAYLMGEADGVAKTAGWAASIAGVDATDLEELAGRMTAGRTMINASWSLQRADHGEQAHWMVVALAAVVGQIGLAGGGFGLGYGAVGSVGNGAVRTSLPSLGRPTNQVDTFIPVSRIADLLLNPGESFDYDGATHTYPETRIVYWCGGNPFHHHQDLNRLVAAWRVPDTIVVHDPYWTATARHADVVLPATTPLEREDFGGAPADDYLFAMPRLVEPSGEARDDYAIFSELAARLGVGEAFTEGRDAAAWVRRLWDRYQDAHPGAPDYDDFVAQGHLQHRAPAGDTSHLRVLLEDFRADPERYPLDTPSGRIELYSETVAGFGYDDCPPHPAWLEPAEWLGNAGDHPLHLISNQPSTRLHSQLDQGPTSQASKVAGREPVRLNPGDAAARGIGDGQVVRVFNDRGEILAGAVLDDAVRPGVVQLATGAWYTPEEPGRVGARCLHGNPNVLTRDAGTSRLAQGPTAQTCLVDVAPLEGDPPLLAPFDPPLLIRTG